MNNLISLSLNTRNYKVGITSQETTTTRYKIIKFISGTGNIR